MTVKKRGDILKDRLKKLRKTLDMTQQSFADKIGMKQNTIAQYEMGRTVPSDAIIFSICREFNVNETWLRTGEGDMFVEIPEEDMFSRAAASCIKDNDKTAMEGLILWRSLPPDARRRVEDYIIQFAELIKAQRKEKE